MPDTVISPVAEETKSVTAPLTFIVPQDEKPYFESSALTGTVPKVHFQTEDKPVRIDDLRPIADRLSVDAQGFELVQHRTAIDDLYDDEAVTGAYYEETVALLKAHFGADHAVVFDATA